MYIQYTELVADFNYEKPSHHIYFKISFMQYKERQSGENSICCLLSTDLLRKLRDTASYQESLDVFLANLRFQFPFLWTMLQGSFLTVYVKSMSHYFNTTYSRISCQSCDNCLAKSFEPGFKENFFCHLCCKQYCNMLNSD